MASRRSRIKGIANIPQRRKPTTEADPAKDDTEEHNLKILPQEDKPTLGVGEATTPGLHSLRKTNDSIGEANIAPGQVEKDTTTSTTGPAPIQPAFNRRRLIKPAISLKAIQKTSTPAIISSTTDEPEVPKVQEEPSPPENANCSAMSPTISSPPSISKQSPFKEGINKEISVLGITKLPLGPSMDNNCDEVARPPPACSPSKYMNRARIKAVPRLGQRRPSFSIGSASESEDESKKSTYKASRKRNDSVCSSISVAATAVAAVPAESPVVAVQEPGYCSPRKKQEFNMVIQRKCRRTEQSRKLAEARREFQLKFRNGTPDKQRLTMIDLIFYNPTGSPMSQKRKRKDSDSESIISQREEDVDDAPPPPASTTDADAEQSDEENTVPAPQITIGANGEIVVDEKSLYVENKSVKRDREKLQNSNIVDGDDFDECYGVFKRPKRAKDWSKEETLRFYKALNTLGTDFALMCGIFPGRSRRELKMKFSKEERINRALVDRALMNPIHFDLTDLERDLAKEEMEKARKEVLKKDVEDFKERQRAERAAKEGSESKNKENDRQREGKRKRRRVRILNKEEVDARMALKAKLQKGVYSLLGDSDNEESTKNSVIDAEKETDVTSSSEVLNDDLISSQDIPLASSTQKETCEVDLRSDRVANTEDTEFVGVDDEISSFEQLFINSEDISLVSNIQKERTDSVSQSIDNDQDETGRIGDITIDEMEEILNTHIEDDAPVHETIFADEEIIIPNDSEVTIQEGILDMEETVQEDTIIEEDTILETEDTNSEDCVEGSVVLSTSIDESGQEVYKAFTIGKAGEKIPIDLPPEVMGALLGNNIEQEAETTETETLVIEEQEKSVETEIGTTSQSTEELNIITEDSNDSVAEHTDETHAVEESTIDDGAVVDITMSSIQESELSSDDCIVLPFDDMGDVVENTATNIVAIDSV